MTDPITMALVAGAASSMFSAVQEHGAAQDATDYNSRIAAEQSADVAVETEQALKQSQRESYLRSGKAYASAAAGGGISGSAIDILTDSAAQSALDLLTIKQTGLSAQKKIKSDEAMSRKKTEPSIMGTAFKVITAGTSAYGKMGTK